MRTSAYRQRILELLQRKHLLRMADIHREIPEADYSTVFRNVEQLLKDGAVKQVLIDSKTVAYESAADSHDHFICTACGKVEALARSLTRRLSGGRAVSDVTVRGTCRACVR